MAATVHLYPPFRAEQIGSLKRPRELLDARSLFDQGKINSDELRVIEDKCIANIVEMQRKTGIKAATDGEFRRSVMD